MARQCSEQKFVTQPGPGIGGKGPRNVRLQPRPSADPKYMSPGLPPPALRLRLPAGPGPEVPRLQPGHPPR
jgi:hypothetical protein